MAAQRENALAAARLADELADFGRQADVAGDALRVALDGMKAKIDALHVIGFNSPRIEQFKALGSRALATHLMSLPIKTDRHHLAPNERHSFRALAARAE